MDFGPNGLLHVGIGDGGPQGDRFGRAQTPDNLFGSVIRINIDNGYPYTIPSDNPFVGGGGAPEVFAYGFRNPWRGSIDAVTG